MKSDRVIILLLSAALIAFIVLSFVKTEQIKSDWKKVVVQSYRLGYSEGLNRGLDVALDKTKTKNIDSHKKKDLEKFSKIVYGED